MTQECKTFFKTKFLKSAIIVFFALLVLEVFVFNYKSFVINPFNSGHYKKTTFDISKAEIDGLNKKRKNIYIANKKDPVIILHVNKDVKTMRLDASYRSPYKITKELVGDIAFSCEGYSNYRVNNKSFHILKSDERTQYVTNASPDGVMDVKITLKLEANDEINLESFSVNEHIPFHFSIIRFLSLFLIVVGIYLLFAYANYKSPYNKKSKSHNCAVIVSMILVLAIAIGVFNLYSDDTKKFFGVQEGNQLTKDLVDAFESGHVYLNDSVPESLMKLENPYDWHARDINNVGSKWDYVMFEGKYYSCYNLGPVILVFLPYHLITGNYFSAELACLLFTLIGLLFLGMAYWEIIKRFFKKLEMRMAILGFFCVEFCTAILISLRFCNFYEISQSAEFCFLAIGFYFMMSSNVLSKDRIKISRVCLSSIFVSFAVLSRAIAALYVVAMVVWFVYGLIKYKKLKTKKLTVIKYIVAFALPYIIFGIVQMAYNYARFKNPFDFGIDHSLTMTDFQRMSMSLGTVMVSIVNFLFVIPKFDDIFPFIHDNFTFLGINGFYFKATNNAIGLFTIFVPAWAYLYTPKAAKFFDKTQKIKLALCWLVPSLIIPIIAIIPTWKYGYAARYAADFAWQICLGALMLIFFMYSRVTDPTMKKWLFRIMVVCTIWCIIGNLGYVLTENPIDANAQSINGAEVYSRIQNAIQFWR